MLAFVSGACSGSSDDEPSVDDARSDARSDSRMDALDARDGSPSVDVRPDRGVPGNDARSDADAPGTCDDCVGEDAEPLDADGQVPEGDEGLDVGSGDASDEAAPADATEGPDTAEPTLEDATADVAIPPDAPPPDTSVIDLGLDVADTREVGPDAADSTTADVADTRDVMPEVFDAPALDVADTAPSGSLAREGDGTYLFRTGQLAMRVSPAYGGRVTELRFDGTELLSRAHPDNNGSVFWTSPQSDWGWPPPEAIDEGVHAANAMGLLLSMESGQSLLRPQPAATGKGPVSVRKEITVGRTGSFDLTYVLRNHASSPISLAPWEVTRLKPGRTFFPYERIVRSQLTWSSSGGGTIAWVNCESQGKLLANGTGGWIAHTFDDMLFVKTYQDVEPSDFAPDEADVEVYHNGAECNEGAVNTNAANYAEVEVQGRYRSIPANSNYAPAWTVRWHATRLPRSNMTRDELVAEARRLNEER